ncbi:hypothetical protein UFOVP1290_537 [uncultured Caudovirales phage]|uniref:Uncharacterized protein n=1 Tax=uncultured Caudovirales phage TaxID=2100421 RepID=A0A6J5RRV6_9CAUD|nr:hypothetical protein UFOVP1290_537 [uncultured Caudovirales phage]
MPCLILRENINKILVVGPIYDNTNVFPFIEKNISHYDYIIINGSLCYPYNNIELVRDRINQLNELLKSNKIIYNASNYDYELLAELYLNNSNKDIIDWINSKPNVIIVTFISQTTTIITSGGVTPKMNRNSLNENIETSFISHINEKPWHLLYNGMYGYIISNNPLTNNDPTFYKYSAQIGNKYSENANVFAQEVDKFGLKKTILIM